MTRPPPPHEATPAELKARLAAERAGRPFLVYADDAGRQQIVVLDASAQRRIPVGRGGEVDVVLGRRRVSGRSGEVRHPPARGRSA